MIKITYIEFDGTPHEVEVEHGSSLMKGAVHNGVPGIDAECGGACACATCHVYISDSWAKKIGSPGSTEKGMLEFANQVRENSRLACQITVTPELDGLIVSMPEFQS